MKTRILQNTTVIITAILVQGYICKIILGITYREQNNAEETFVLWYNVPDDRGATIRTCFPSIAPKQCGKFQISLNSLDTASHSVLFDGK